MVRLVPDEKSSRVVVWLPFTIRGMVTVIMFASRLVSGTTYRMFVLDGPPRLVYRELWWNSVLVVLRTRLVISVNITQLEANRLLVPLTRQNARAFPIRSVIYEVSVE